MNEDDESCAEDGNGRNNFNGTDLSKKKVVKQTLLRMIR